MYYKYREFNLKQKYILCEILLFRPDNVLRKKCVRFALKPRYLLNNTYNLLLGPSLIARQNCAWLLFGDFDGSTPDSARFARQVRAFSFDACKYNYASINHTVDRNEGDR